ncbi:hypothetical protein R80B4_01309 [Fibrobacteres bacterium R8-0-B4]
MAADGTPYIITIPRDFFGEVVSAFEENIIDMATEGKVDPKSLFNTAGDLIPYGPSGTQPILQIAWAFVEWITGQNPEDMYRKREIFPSDVYGDLGEEAKTFAGWAANKMFGGDITETAEGAYNYAKDGKKAFNKPLLDNILEFPGLGRILGQFLRRADGHKK